MNRLYIQFFFFDIYLLNLYKNFIFFFCTQNIRHDHSRLNKWFHKQVYRIIHEYLVRDGKYEIAFDFMNELGLEDFSDIDLYITRSKPIIDSLINRKCDLALKWIQQNRNKLNKTKNPFYREFEMELRIQEFIHLVIENKINESVEYSQKYLLNFATENEANLNRIKQAMGAIIFINQSNSYIYEEFMNDRRWIYLINTFKKVFSKYYQMTIEPILDVILKIGISCLKTTHCYGNKPSINCPICRDDINQISKSFPYVLKTNSSLLCPYSKKIMDESNYPMVLPNGNVYSIETIQQLRKENIIKDPRSGEEYDFNQLKRMYIT